ncbi:MAG: tetratricopeptide repeat protein [Pseudomonadota bacterium]|nr:tetratricopeptide repeat protein [Pseudomonadota bacterium]
MSSPANVIEVNQDNFDVQVRQRSRVIPVLVDFWAPWCAPCRVLSPILAKLGQEYQGQVVVATVDTDKNQRLALEHRIQSIPAVKLYKNGEVIDEFLGVQPESLIRGLLDRHIERESDRQRAAAAAALARGDADAAERLLRQALAIDPDNQRLHPDLARVLVQRGRFEAAHEIIADLPAQRQLDEDISALRIRIDFARVAHAAPEEATLRQLIDADPGDCEARYQLSVRLITGGRFDPALEQLMEIIRRDRRYRDDGARKAIVDVFTLLGPQDPLVRRYRALMSSALY